jgi:hypothetical protein
MSEAILFTAAEVQRMREKEIRAGEKKIAERPQQYDREIKKLQ